MSVKLPDPQPGVMTNATQCQPLQSKLCPDIGVPVTNLFAGIAADLPEELCETILSARGLRVERIVSKGHCSPGDFWYDQGTHEWVLLMTGAARLRLEHQEPLDLAPGDFINIPAHTRHRVEWTDPQQTTIWLAVHYW
jgi:cupin 2 domain-containing protein